jgi:ribosomal protein S18 acetylase RimI-like enzyme
MLRRVDKAFARQLVDLWSTTFEDAYRDLHSEENIRAYCDSNYTIDAAEAALSDPRSVCKVAFRDREAVGFYLVRHCECPVRLEGESSELKQLYVRSSEYGSGAGRTLIEDAVWCARAAGRSWLWLSVSDLNDRARSFYRNLGFEALGSGPVLEVGSDRLTSTIMALELE